MTGLRMLTVRQPYSWGISHGGKDRENRSSDITGGYRGWVGLHAAKGVDDGFASQFDEVIERIGVYPNSAIRAALELMEAQRGHVTALVWLSGVHRRCPQPEDRVRDGDPVTLCSPWAIWGQWHLDIGPVHQLREPVPARGFLGLWQPGAALAEAVWQQAAPRHWTPLHHDPATGQTTIHVHRSCNGCGRSLGDATPDELSRAITGSALPDVRPECGCGVAE